MKYQMLESWVLSYFKLNRQGIALISMNITILDAIGRTYRSSYLRKKLSRLRGKKNVFRMGMDFATNNKMISLKTLKKIHPA